MQVQLIDHAALLPLYLAAGTAAIALFAGRFAKACMMIGLGAAAVAAVSLAAGPDRATFAVAEWHSYVADEAAMGAAALFAALSVLVAAVSGRQSGEYWFLLAVSAAGGITLAGSRDLITLIVALETLTVPLYVLVTKPGRDGAEAGVTFLIASIAASATALMGAAFLYAAAGTVHFDGLAARLAGADPGLVAAGAALLLGGLAFKLAAAPLHAWVPLVLERAPLPVATYLASASKLGGAIAIIWVVYFGLEARAGMSTGLVVAALSVASIVIGNLGALAQRRTVPLWPGQGSPTRDTRSRRWRWSRPRPAAKTRARPPRRRSRTRSSSCCSRRELSRPSRPCAPRARRAVPNPQVSRVTTRIVVRQDCERRAPRGPIHGLTPGMRGLAVSAKAVRSPSSPGSGGPRPFPPRSSSSP
jgi:hypothetical protein